MCNKDNKDSFRKPSKLLQFAGLGVNDKVLDVSTGFGYLARHIAAKTTKTVDAQNGGEWRELFESFGIQKAIDSMESDHNIRHHWFSFENAGLDKNAEYDLVTVQNSLHDLYDLPVDRSKFFSSIRTALKPKGRLLVVDHKAGKGRGSKDTKDLHRIEESVVREELEASGFIVVKTSDMFAYPLDDYSKSAWNEPNIETNRFVLLCNKIDDELKKSKEAEDTTKTTEGPPLKKAKETHVEP